MASSRHALHYVACFQDLLHGRIVCTFFVNVLQTFAVQTALSDSQPEREALEELIGMQALTTDLKPALLAQISRRLKELEHRFDSQKSFPTRIEKQSNLEPILQKAQTRRSRRRRRELERRTSAPQPV